MAKRPLSVTIISLVLIATGALGLVSHISGFGTKQPFEFDVVWIVLLGLAAILAGAYMLRASNWARWLSIAWIGFHVIISFFHSFFEASVHILVLVAFAYFLFRTGAREYFRVHI